MPGAFTIATIHGVSFRVHFSWLFVFALVTWSLAAGWLPTRYEGWSVTLYWTIGAMGSVFLFMCVAIHEFSHSLEATRRGLMVRSVTLFLLGGYSVIEDPRSAREEFWVSAAGPIASLALAAVFGLLYYNVRASESPFAALTQYLAFANFFIALFNLAPAYPLDGGRVLRALVWRATNSERRASQVAGFAGVSLGYGLIGGGVALALIAPAFTSLWFSGVWIAAIGWFIRSAASSAGRQSARRVSISGRRVGEAMSAFESVPPGMTIQRLIEERMAADLQRVYLVTLGDTFHGIITASDALRAPAAERARAWVSQAMTRASDVHTLAPSDTLEDGLAVLADNEIQQAPVIEDGKPVGLLTRHDVLRVMEVSQLAPGNPDAEPQPPE